MAAERDDEIPLPRSSFKVGIVFNLKKDRTSQIPDDQAEYDSIETIKAIKSAMESYGLETELFEADEHLPLKLCKSNCSIMFNIAEGGVGRGREAQVPSILGLLGIPYTGSDETTLSIALDKSLTKRLLSTFRIRTPRQTVLEKNLSNISNNIKYPVIIKPNAEGSGKGISSCSVVKNKTELQNMAVRNMNLYQTDFLAEEFIEGREFTVGILGNGDDLRVFPPMEIIFKENEQDSFPIYSYEVKKDFHRYVNYQCPAEISDGLSQELMKTARKAYNALKCRDFARVDFRCSKENKVYFIEINPIPGLAPNYSDFPMIASYCGIGYDDLIIEVLKAATVRYGLAFLGDKDDFS